MYTRSLRPDELLHYDVLGMKWGVRRYQPYAQGEKVQGGIEIGEAKKLTKQLDKLDRKDAKTTHKALKSSAEIFQRTNDVMRKTEKYNAKQTVRNAKKLDKAKNKLDEAKNKGSKIIEEHNISSKEMSDALSTLKSNGYDVYTKRVSNKKEVSPAVYNQAMKILSNQPVSYIRPYKTTRIIPIVTPVSIGYVMQTVYNVNVAGHKYKIRKHSEPVEDPNTKR